MTLTSREAQTRRNRLFTFEAGLAWQIAVMPLLAATAAFCGVDRASAIVRPSGSTTC
jgi:hypothetical protein